MYDIFEKLKSLNTAPTVTGTPEFLVVGLGNREITPDALGPQVIQNLKITRHIIKEYGKAGVGKRKAHQISSLVPGVMAQTGMETMEIIRGVIRMQ